MRWFAFTGCLVGLTACQSEKQEQAQQNYAIATIHADANKEITTSYSASIEGMQDINIYPQVSTQRIRRRDCTQRANFVRHRPSAL